MLGGIDIFIAPDAAAAHFFVGTHVELRKILLAEEDVEAQPQDSEPQDGDRSYDGGTH
ncbi:MAG: hypothetical protein IK031_06095 [Bacteroidales bacterium]|nr:hypothetical protein [Bacteroidales bacterium]